MSRLAKRPIVIPSGVEVKVQADSIFVKGPKGSMTQNFPEGVSIDHNDNNLVVNLDETKLDRPFHGLYHSLVKNSIIGVSKGFDIKLVLIGVGFRAATKGNELELQLGFSHPCSLKIPEGVEVKVEKNASILITGVNKQVVGQFAADIRALRPPEPYKGKGVRYENEYVRRKAGKAAKGK